eukprot:TRINITY_DN14468_c1_g1_i4.p2 TRINITY_DN14468_c1_g1~~TRINITY_DN14468_c1_g1_i4.p2  ORF type:complete len:310 (-),score=100.21 TRINITY_DN14468_c1_g1_i4:96-1025(-)
MAKLMRKMAILAKIEAVRGTDSVPTGAANAILASEVTLTPIEGDVVQRDNIKPYFGSRGSVLVTQYSKIAFSVEIAGVAAAGDVPAYAALLRGCAISVTTQAGVSTTFAPVTDALESLTIYGNVDGVLHKMTDAHGNVKAVVDAKGIPKWQFEFTGSFIPATDTALPAPVYTAFQRPLGVNKANTTLSLDALNVAASAFAFDAGTTVVKRDLMNVDSVEITDRVSTGSVTFENTSVATKNWIGMARSSAVVAMSLKHGQGVTNVVEINAARAQIGKPTYSDSDGVQMITVPLEFLPSDAGNDEWSIVVY